MKFYAIYAYETIYGGLHGMNQKDVVAVDFQREAEEIAKELSIEVMNSYGDIEENIQEEIEGLGIYQEDNEEEYWNMYEEIVSQNIEYSIYLLDETKFSENFSLEKLSNQFYNSPHEFIEMYGAEGEKFSCSEDFFF